jgi:putative NADH-flavin reductase
MEKVKQNMADTKVKKTAFTMDEYDNLILDLDLIVASLHATSDHDSNVFDISPIISEALTRAINTKNLISSMHPAEVTA